MDNSKEWTFVVTYHEIFYAIAYRHCSEAERLEKDFWERHRDMKTTLEGLDFRVKNEIAINQVAIIAIVFSALTLEAFINHYAIDKESRTFFDNYLDKLDPVSKWVIIPRLLVGKQLDTGSQFFEWLRESFTLRNNLVHFKTKTLTENQMREKGWGKVWYTAEDAKKALDTVKKVVTELTKLDPKVDTKWLSDQENLHISFV